MKQKWDASGQNRAGAKVEPQSPLTINFHLKPSEFLTTKTKDFAPGRSSVQFVLVNQNKHKNEARRYNLNRGGKTTISGVKGRSIGVKVSKSTAIMSDRVDTLDSAEAARMIAQAQQKASNKNAEQQL